MIVKCEVCGAPIEKIDENNMAKCSYCETINVITNNKDKIENLFNRATFYRQNNEYKKASEIYEEILKEDNSDAAAHWGLLLCEFGIEFVYDEKTGKKTVTCHKLQNNSILDAPEYREAMKNANIQQKYIFEQEAKEINDIYEKLYQISKEVEPFDIFISYKEKLDEGQRTKDSVEAQKIYEELKNKGYKVFFARKTLEKHLGKEYEPVIFSALRSSKVMVLVGSSDKNINSVWVKNEWSRFLELMEEDSSKTIIPCYFDMNPYDLPLELSKVQALDLSKIGFVQDLIDGIERIINKKSGQVFDYSNEKIGSAEHLYGKALVYEKLEEYDSLKNIYEQMKTDYPGDYRGWWGCAKYYSQDFTQYNKYFEIICTNATNALKLADGREKEKIEKIWEKYYNTFFEELYDSKMNDLLEHKNKIVSEINDLSDEVNKFQDYNEKREKSREAINSINHRIQTLEGKDTWDERQKKYRQSRDKKMIIKIVIAALISIGVGISFVYYLVVAREFNIKDTEALTFIIIVLGTIGASITVIINNIKTSKGISNLKKEYDSEQEELEYLRISIMNEKDSLRQIVANIDYQNGRKKELNKKENELRNIEKKISDFKEEGKTVYEGV